MKSILVILFFSVGPVLAQTSYVKDWLVLGSFPNQDAVTRLSRDYVGGEAQVLPRGGESVQGRQWLLYHSPREFLDFLWSDFEFGARERCVVYAAFFVQTPESQRVHLLVGSDDGIAVWCNGRRIHFADVVRGLQSDSDTVDADLVEGWNTILLKVANAEGGFGTSARFSDGKGLLLTALNPFDVRQDLTPPLVLAQTSKGSIRFTLTSQDQLAGVLELPCVNKGSSQATGVELVLIAGSIALPGAPPQDIAGGELKNLVKHLTFREVGAIAQAAAPLRIRLTYGRRDTTFPLASSRETLAGFFSPWSLTGWKEKQLDEKRVSVSRKFVVPEELVGLGLQFAVDVGERWGTVSVNGKPMLPRFSGDSGELWLTPAAHAGDRFEIEVTVNADKPIRGNVLVSSTLRPRNEIIEKYLLDTRFAKEIYKVDLGDQSSVVARIFELLQNHDLHKLDATLQPVSQRLAHITPDAKKLSLHLIGNAHIDMAWLWRYPETIEVTRATFQSALDNLKWYPDFRLSHGQAHSYQWIEQRYPDMFQEIQRYVKLGRWEIVGGTWVESDANIPSGESLIRQYLYGKRYFKKKFGVDVKHGFFPDTFGHTATLPQILDKSGIETYTFFRPGEDERMFWWESPDGSRVFAHHPSNWYGTWSGIPDTLWTAAVSTHQKHGVPDAIQFFGVGDHGGGPTRRQIEQIQQLSKVNLYPATQMSTFDAYYGKLLSEKKNAVVQRGELNPAFEGCYTSQ